jgi:hypothetical protein
VADSAADAHFEGQKRRSTRLQQAVPLTVTGVDALGRSFQERSSTVVVSCHGCRYQSKHYVLKNTWITLEVPHSEAGRPPRMARARVAWIQRPRTVRDLFQIGVELDVPGNLWGIAFPEQDWFPLPESSELATATAAAPTPATADNLRVISVVAPGEAAPSLPYQMTDFLEQAKQELQLAIRNEAAQAAAAELPPLLAALRNQMDEAAQQSIQAVAESAIQQARSALLNQVDDAGKEQEDRIRGQLDSLLQQATAQIQETFQGAQAGLSQTRETLSSVRQEAASLRDAAIEEMQQRFSARAEETQSHWHSRLHADLSAATELWHQRIDSSLESAAQKAAERLTRNSQAAADRVENELGSRFSSLGKVFAEATGEAEQKLNTLRAAMQIETSRAKGAMAQLQSAGLGIDEHAARIDSVTRNAHQELQRRAATVLEAQSRELAHRAEELLASWTDRLQPALETAGEQAVARLVPQMDQELAERLKPANHAYARLERGVAAMDEALRHYQETITKGSDHVVETARGRLQETIDRMSHEMEEAGRASSAKWLAEIDAKAMETTHSTFESLYKTADWYEKKVQTHMQSALDKGLDQASSNLREKAGEISRVFAAELDHYHRSYADHARGQIEEIAREIVERTRQQTAELTDTSLASFAKQAAERAKAALADLHAQVNNDLNQISAQASARLAQFRTDVIEESNRLGTSFREDLSAARNDALTGARQDLGMLTASALNEQRNESRLQQAQLVQSLAAAADPAIEEYKKRLETASSSWLLTTVSRLDQQSQQMIRAIAESAQEQLRQACAQVFADAGSRLRDQSVETDQPPAARSAAAGS